MEITRSQKGQIVELLIEGRMDVYWAEHLSTAVREEIRQGLHHIRLDLSKVPYLSSAGIGVLVRLHQELKSIGGSFALANCSPTALKSLQITNLAGLLVANEAATGSSAGEPVATPKQTARPGQRVEKDGAIFEVYALRADARVECALLGDPRLAERSGFGKENCQTAIFSANSFAIGLGALGENFEDCEERFGEFLAAGGAVAYLPADGTNTPDFLLAATGTQPEAQVCYGIRCDAGTGEAFQNLIRFEAGDTRLPLSSLLETCLQLANAKQAGVVMIVEPAQLVGAALRRSPVLAHAGGDIFTFPQVREWLTFTAEPAHIKSVALLSGVAVQEGCAELDGWIRPLGSRNHGTAAVSGHVHAAAFGYQPVPKGKIELCESVKRLFEGRALEGILHLLCDDRNGADERESEFVRGACWIAPIEKIRREEARG
jgi:anti-anti-sigma factor